MVGVEGLNGCSDNPALCTCIYICVGGGKVKEMWLTNCLMYVQSLLMCW